MLAVLRNRLFWYWCENDKKMKTDHPENMCHCARCKGYGREITIYGKLLKEVK